VEKLNRKRKERNGKTRVQWLHKALVGAEKPEHSTRLSLKEKREGRADFQNLCSPDRASRRGEAVRSLLQNWLGRFSGKGL